MNFRVDFLSPVINIGRLAFAVDKRRRFAFHARERRKVAEVLHVYHSVTHTRVNLETHIVIIGGFRAVTARFALNIFPMLAFIVFRVFLDNFEVGKIRRIYIVFIRTLNVSERIVVLDYHSVVDLIAIKVDVFPIRVRAELFGIRVVRE